MEEVYDAVVEEVSELAAMAMMEREGFLPEDALNVDVSARELFRRCGARVVERVYAKLGATAAADARGRGMTVNRSVEIGVSCVFGEVRVASPYYRNRATGESERPVKTQMGLTHRCKTPAVKRALSDFGIEDSFGLAAERFEEHYGWSVGRTSVLRVVEDCAAEAQDYIATRLEGPVSASAKWGMLVELDGCEIRTGVLQDVGLEGTTPVRGLPRRRRAERWRDVRLGFARPLGEESKTFVGGMSPYDEVVAQLHDVARLEGMTKGTVVVAAVDGGNGLREARSRPTAVAGRTASIARPTAHTASVEIGWSVRK